MEINGKFLPFNQSLGSGQLNGVWTAARVCESLLLTQETNAR